MAKIVIKNIKDAELITKDKDISVLKVIHSNYIDWMHACGAKGRCTTCKMIVNKGFENLTHHSEFEQKVLSAGKLKSNERLACQCSVTNGDIEIMVPEENKLPHMEYYEE